MSSTPQTKLFFFFGLCGCSLVPPSLDEAAPKQVMSDGFTSLAEKLVRGGDVQCAFELHATVDACGWSDGTLPQLLQEHLSRDVQASTTIVACLMNSLWCRKVLPRFIRPVGYICLQHYCTLFNGYSALLLEALRLFASPVVVRSLACCTASTLLLSSLGEQALVFLLSHLTIDDVAMLSVVGALGQLLTDPQFELGAVKRCTTKLSVLKGLVDVLWLVERALNNETTHLCVSALLSVLMCVSRGLLHDLPEDFCDALAKSRVLVAIFSEPQRYVEFFHLIIPQLILEAHEALLCSIAQFAAHAAPAAVFLDIWSELVSKSSEALCSPIALLSAYFESALERLYYLIDATDSDLGEVAACLSSLAQSLETAPVPLMDEDDDEDQYLEYVAQLGEGNRQKVQCVEHLRNFLESCSSKLLDRFFRQPREVPSRWWMVIREQLQCHDEDSRLQLSFQTRFECPFTTAYVAMEKIQLVLGKQIAAEVALHDGSPRWFGYLSVLVSSFAGPVLESIEAAHHVYQFLCCAINSCDNESVDAVEMLCWKCRQMISCPEQFYNLLHLSSTITAPAQRHALLDVLALVAPFLQFEVPRWTVICATDCTMRWFTILTHASFVDPDFSQKALKLSVDRLEELGWLCLHLSLTSVVEQRHVALLFQLVDAHIRSSFGGALLDEALKISSAVIRNVCAGDDEQLLLFVTTHSDAPQIAAPFLSPEAHSSMFVALLISSCNYPCLGESEISSLLDVRFVHIGTQETFFAVIIHLLQNWGGTAASQVSCCKRCLEVAERSVPGMTNGLLPNVLHSILVALRRSSVIIAASLLPLDDEEATCSQEDILGSCCRLLAHLLRRELLLPSGVFLLDIIPRLLAERLMNVEVDIIDAALLVKEAIVRSE